MQLPILLDRIFVQNQIGSHTFNFSSVSRSCYCCLVAISMTQSPKTGNLFKQKFLRSAANDIRSPRPIHNYYRYKKEQFLTFLIDNTTFSNAMTIWMMIMMDDGWEGARTVRSMKCVALCPGFSPLCRICGLSLCFLSRRAHFQKLVPWFQATPSDYKRTINSGVR